MRLFFFLVLVQLPFRLVGQTPGWSDIKLLDVISSDSVSIHDLAEQKGIVVVFTSDACAFDAFYIDRVAKLVKTYSDRIQFLLVNSNLDTEEPIKSMNMNYPKRKIFVPYLADKDQLLLAGLGAKKTPEVFLLATAEGKMSIYYSGAIDDNPQVAADVKQDYLRANIENLLTDQKPTESTRAVGCSIRKK
jgi:hypothetical protein